MDSVLLVVHLLWSAVVLINLYVVHKAVERYVYLRGLEALTLNVEKISWAVLTVMRGAECR